VTLYFCRDAACCRASAASISCKTLLIKGKVRDKLLGNVMNSTIKKRSKTHFAA